MRNIYLLVCWLLLCSTPLKGQRVSPCLLSRGIVDTFCVTAGNALIEDPWCAGIPRQIARSFNAEGLSNWITPEKCWGWLGTEGTAYNDQVIPPGNTPVNCTPPYDRCYGNYCPDKYCSIIETMTDLRASIILRAVNTWGRYAYLKSGTSFYAGMRQLVVDINAAYDCKGLRRPVIQGTVFEHIDNGVDGVPLPADVISRFVNDRGFDKRYYLERDGRPRTTLYFRFDRIRSKRPGLGSCPDITRIEARMWFYYLAKMYIDLGYTSIHMGQLNDWGRADQPRYSQTAAILTRIRDYARSQRTFVLLTQENFRALKYPGTDTFMFDYDSRALRLRELSDPQVCGDFNCDNTPVNYLAHSPCASEVFPAVIDQCVLDAQGNSGGYNPLTGSYTPYQPYNTYFDFGPGNYPDTGVASSGCGPEPKWGTWGWDDTKWFAQKIQEPCRAFWIDDAIRRLRRYHHGFGFMSAPGLLAVNMPENEARYLKGQNPTANAAYLLSDEASVKEAVQRGWAIADNARIFIDRFCTGNEGSCQPNDTTSHPKRASSYTFRVSGYDYTTVYTWHIQHPDGTWLPLTFGTARSFKPTADGIYTIVLRMDNLGKFDNNSTIKVASCKVALCQYCCDDAPFYPGTSSGDYPKGSLPYTINDDLGAYNKYAEGNRSRYQSGFQLR